MSQYHIQTAFHTGELAPSLYARVDLAKYHSAAALLENFYVDYRGGASSRPGTKYILQAYKSATAVRLIPFQASFTVNYVLEFGDQYIRFFNNGSPILETAVTGGTGCSGNTFTIANTLAVGDWVLVSAWGGMTNVNGNYYIVATAAAGSFTVTDLFGATPTFTGSYTSGGQFQRVYTIASPFAAADLALVKYAQSVNALILCHPSYSPQVLTLVSAANWTIGAIPIGAGINTPAAPTVTNSIGAGTFNFAYKVTAVSSTGEESPGSAAGTTTSSALTGQNTITWTAVPGAQSYNVYEANNVVGAAVPTGAAFGFIANTLGTTLYDQSTAGLTPDFSQTPPVASNPFQGTGVTSATVTAAGTYTSVPTITFAAPALGSNTATGSVTLGVISSTLAAGGVGYTIGETDVILGVPGLTATVLTVGAANTVTSYRLNGSSTVTSGSTPSNPVSTLSPTGASGFTLNLTWGVNAVIITNAGGGYTSAPAITFSSGAGAATANLGGAAAGNPSVPGFFQQRLCLAGPQLNPQELNYSITGAYYNFNISEPTEADDSISASLVSGQLNTIKSMVAQPSGHIILTDQALWMVNAGGTGAPITPGSLTASPQAFIGASDVPPIVSNFDILYVQAKGSVVRDATFNFYTNIYAGTDISVLSSHLFYGYTVKEWAWAEEPFKLVWTVRSDGVMLSLTFMKEQELMGWTHHTTTGGSFKSVCTITEASSVAGSFNAVYCVVSRTVNAQTVQYIERFAERIFPNGATDAWCVDAGIQYSGAPATSFSGAQHLAGLTVTGLADGSVITPFVMPASGSFTLPAASKVTVGIGYNCNLQTLPLDVGEPTIQERMKKIGNSSIKVQETLGLQIGTSSSNLVAMKDLVVGNVGSMTNAVVAGLVTGDVRTYLDPLWQIQGQYYIRQPSPLPAQILGVIPEFFMGDNKK